MITRHAACSCGHPHLTCEGEPVPTSMGHCLECRRRTGRVFGNQAWFDRRQISDIAGTSTRFVRSADSGNSVAFSILCGLWLDSRRQRQIAWSFRSGSCLHDAGNSEQAARRDLVLHGAQIG